MDDYEVTGIGQSKDPIVHFALFADCDPVTFEEAVKQSKWRKAMDEELATIERNNTWKLTELPEGQKTIDVKWIFKTKLKKMVRCTSIKLAWLKKVTSKNSV